MEAKITRRKITLRLILREIIHALIIGGPATSGLVMGYLDVKAMLTGKGLILLDFNHFHEGWIEVTIFFITSIALLILAAKDRLFRGRKDD